MIRLGGIVLCGGASSRMGTPKAWLPFGEEVLLQRVVRIVGSVVSPVVVVAARTGAVPDLPPEVRVIRDLADYCGPLAGVALGLQALGDEVEAVYVSACDVPLLRSAFVRRVAESLGMEDIVLPEVDGWVQPLAGVYRTSVLPTVQRLLDEPHARLTDVLHVHAHRVLAPALFHDVDEHLVSLRNCNTPTEYHALRQASTV